MTASVEDAPVEGLVRLGCSLFPVNITIGEHTYGGVRFMLVASGDGWIAGAWQTSRRGRTNEPVRLIYDDVAVIEEYSTSAIRMRTVDDVPLTITAAAGCGCGGSRLRNYNPFGGATLALVPPPRT